MSNCKDAIELKQRGTWDDVSLTPPLLASHLSYQAEDERSTRRHNNRVRRDMERQDPARTRSYKTWSEKREMGRDEVATKKVRFTSSLVVTLTLAISLIILTLLSLSLPPQKEKDATPYRDIDGCLQRIGTRPFMSPRDIHKLIIYTDDDLTDDDLDSTKRYTQFKGHYCTGEEAVITASSLDKLFVINPGQIAKVRGREGNVACCHLLEATFNHNPPTTFPPPAKTETCKPYDQRLQGEDQGNQNIC